MLVQWMQELVQHVQQTSGDPYLANLKEGHEKKWAPWFSRLINSETGIIYIAIIKDTPVGFVLGQVTKPFLSVSLIKSIGQIELCWVNPQYRHKGAASKLINALEKWFKCKGLKYIDVQYLIGNIEAEQCWEKTGYVPYRISSRKEL